MLIHRLCERSAIEKANHFFMIARVRAIEYRRNCFTMFSEGGTKSFNHFPYRMPPRSWNRFMQFMQITLPRGLGRNQDGGSQVHWNVDTGGVVSGTRPSCGLFRQWNVHLCCIDGIDHVFHNNLCPLSTSFQWSVFLWTSPYCLPMRGPGILRLHREFQLYLV